jgi:cobalt/nickel transport system ATP-binding protein
MNSRQETPEKKGQKRKSSQADTPDKNPTDKTDPPLEDILVIDDVHYCYPDGTSALNGVDLAIKLGTNTTLLGPNGAGKSTLFQLIMGFVTPTAGEIRLFNETMSRDKLELLRRRVGIVFQNPDDQLFCPSIKEDVSFGLRNQGNDEELIHKSTKEALSLVGLWDKRDKNPYHLSHGEKKRAALATVLAMKPELLLLDEPSAHLDPGSKNDLLKILSSYEGTVLIITQDLFFASTLCKKAAVMQKGRIILDKPINEILAQPRELERLEIAHMEHCRVCTKYGWHRATNKSKEL